MLNHRVICWESKNSLLKVGAVSPGWKTSNCNLVTTLETNSGSALAKNGTAATNERQLKFITSWNRKKAGLKNVSIMLIHNTHSILLGEHYFKNHLRLRLNVKAPIFMERGFSFSLVLLLNEEAFLFSGLFMCVCDENETFFGP